MFLSPEYKYSDKYKECMVAQTQKMVVTNISRTKVKIVL